MKTQCNFDLKVIPTGELERELVLYHYSEAELAPRPAKLKFQWLLASLHLLNKAKGVHSRITPDAAKDRW